MNYTKELNNFITAMQRINLQLKIEKNGNLTFTVKDEVYYDDEAFSDALGAIYNARQQSKINCFIFSLSSLRSVTVNMKALKLEQLKDYFAPRLNYVELKEIIAFLLSQGYTKDWLQSELGIGKMAWSRIFASNKRLPEASNISDSSNRVFQQESEGVPP